MVNPNNGVVGGEEKRGQIGEINSCDKKLIKAIRHCPHLLTSKCTNTDASSPGTVTSQPTVGGEIRRVGEMVFF